MGEDLEFADGADPGREMHWHDPAPSRVDDELARRTFDRAGQHARISPARQPFDGAALFTSMAGLASVP